jgi:predicted AAA+ superfamily ATPase
MVRMRFSSAVLLHYRGDSTMLFSFQNTRYLRYSPPVVPHLCLTGSGKSQLCMMTAAKTASRGERVVYIDTSNAFSAPRVLDMLRAMAPAEQPVVRFFSLELERFVVF